MWCGDDLYNRFARDERFEPTVFLCLRTDQSDKQTVRKDFLHGVEQFKSHGINVVPVAEIKPHPNLLFSAVETGVFPSAEAFEAYLQAWNDLPNAQVHTGAYYQALCVDGRDLNGIALLMQKVFIEGNDPLKDARRKVFDEYLNYYKRNGMTASEFIFKSIADELR